MLQRKKTLSDTTRPSEEVIMKIIKTLNTNESVYLVVAMILNKAVIRNL